MTHITGPAHEEWTALQLVDRFGPIRLSRIRTKPVPGTATEADLLQIEARENRLCELSEGMLIEKCMGTEESALAVQLITILNVFVRAQRLGIVLGPDGMLELAPGLVRIPDVSFISVDKLTNGRLPSDPIARIVPDLAVEVLSPGNTPQEMERKLNEYFEYGTRQVWYIDLRQREIDVYRSPKDYSRLTANDVLTGDPVLPGFSVSVSDIFE